MRIIKSWKKTADLLKNETMALYWAYKDPRVPWYAKVLLAAILGYAISPIDLIPDFIPVLGFLDDLIIIPGGIFIAIKMIPTGVLAECRMKAKSTVLSSKAKWVMAGIIASIWVLVIVLLIKFIWQTFF